MPLETAKDLAGFFDNDEHAVSATWSEACDPIDGIYEAPYFQDELTGETAGIESTQPIFRCQAADVATAAHGQTLRFNGTTYEIVNVRPDGTGVVDLVLRET